MKFRFYIEGGFANIPRLVEGTIPDNEFAELVQECVKDGAGKKNNPIADGFSYRVELQAGEEEYKASFTDKTLPAPLRQLLDRQQ